MNESKLYVILFGIIYHVICFTVMSCIWGKYVKHDSIVALGVSLELLKHIHYSLNDQDLHTFCGSFKGKRIILKYKTIYLIERLKAISPKLDILCHCI
jgi:hypothetical protein